MCALSPEPKIPESVTTHTVLPHLSHRPMSLLPCPRISPQPHDNGCQGLFSLEIHLKSFLVIFSFCHTLIPFQKI